MANLIALIVGLVVFASLVGGWLWISAAWDRVNVVKIERTKGRVELIGFRYRGR